MKDYYEVLEVNPKASEDIIKKVYRIKIKLNHPDLFQGAAKQKAEEITRDLTVAYNTLIDKTKREEYDHNLKETSNNTETINLIEKLKYENSVLRETLEKKNKLIENYIDDLKGANPLLTTFKSVNQQNNIDYINNLENDTLNKKINRITIKIPQKLSKFLDYFIIIFAVILLVFFLINTLATKLFSMI